MSQTESPKINRLLSLTGIVGAILVFAVILYVAYLPGRPPAVDQKVHEERKQKADEARAAGLAKINGYNVNPDTKIIQIPIEAAMELTVTKYKVSESANN